MSFKTFDELVEDVACFSEDERPILLGIRGRHGNRVADFYTIESFVGDVARVALLVVEERGTAPCVVHGEQRLTPVLYVDA